MHSTEEVAGFSVWAVRGLLYESNSHPLTPSRQHARSRPPGAGPAPHPAGAARAQPLAGLRWRLSTTNAKSAFNPPVIELGRARLEAPDEPRHGTQLRRWNEARHATQLRPAAAVHGRGRGGAAPASCVSRHAGPHTCGAISSCGPSGARCASGRRFLTRAEGFSLAGLSFFGGLSCLRTCRPAAARACSSGVACGQTTRRSSGTTLLFSHEARARGAALASRHAGTHALRSSA